MKEQQWTKSEPPRAQAMATFAWSNSTERQMGPMYLKATQIIQTKKIVASFSPGHGRREHDGVVTVVDPSFGPDELSFAKTINPSPDFRDPWAFSETAFMAAHRTRIGQWT